MADEENPLGGGPFGVGPFGPLVAAAVVAATSINAGASVTTSQAGSRTLYYQAKIFVAAPPEVLTPAVASAESFSITTGQVFQRTLYYQSYTKVIYAPPAEVAATVEWISPLSRAPRATPRILAQNYLPFVPPPAPVVTADEWLPRWQGPPSYHPAPAGGSPFVPKEATLENTVTPDKWLQPFSKAVPTPKPVHTQPVFGYPYEAAVVSNLTTTLEWMRPFYQAAPHAWPIKQVLPFVPKEAVLENTVTPDKWLQAWKGPPRYTPAPQGGSPFIPREAVLENTVTPDKWLQAWRGPPRAVPAQAGGSPFVPKEAVLENTITPDKWLVRFAKAVPVPKPVPTQPVFGYPYTSQAIVVPYEQWWHQPLSRAAARPAVHAKPYQPFVPKEAVLENTQTPDKWLQRWQAPPAYRPIKVQTPPFVPREATRENTVTPDKWHRDLSKPVAATLARPTQPPFVYSPPAVENTVTIDKWQQPLSVAVRTPRARPTQPSLYLPAVVVVAEEATAESFSVTWAYPVRKSLFYQAKIAPQYVPVFVENTVTPDKWLKPLGIAVKRPPVWPTQPFFGYPYEAVPPDAVPGGPADEPERVICLLEHSRVAVVPEALRSATVLVTSRVATVPELSRTVEALFSDREEDSNTFRTLPCVAPIPEPEQDAFQVDDAFQDSTFQ